MARKHNTKHSRSGSRYKERLTARGLSKAPLMADYIGCGKGRKASATERADAA